MNPFGAKAKRLVYVEQARRCGRTLADQAAGKPVRKERPVRKSRALRTPQPIDDIDLPAGLRVVCPWPPVVLSPNARVHWSKRSRAAKAYRQECWALALAAKLHLVALPAGPIRLQLDFFPPDRARRDDDNAIASFKAARDGIADALKVDDSRFVTSHRFRIQPRACVVVTILTGEA